MTVETPHQAHVLEQSGDSGVGRGEQRGGAVWAAKGSERRLLRTWHALIGHI